MMVLPMGPWGGGIASAYQITNSLLFHGGQGLYRSFTSSSTWGMSVWIRRNTLGAINPILGTAVRFNSNDTLTAGSLTTTAVYRDSTAWMHISIANGRLWVNGADMGAVTTSSFICSPTNCLGYDGTNYLNAEVTEFAFTDGTQPPYSPGRIDGATGSWAPNPVSVTWGTNGSYIGKPWDSASLGTDYSGQVNDWTPSGFTASDVLSDSPTNVYATLSKLKGFGTSPTNGNLSVVSSVSSWHPTHAVSSGKWWAEVATPGSVVGTGFAVYVRPANSQLYASPDCNAYNTTYYRADGVVYENGSSVATWASYAGASAKINVALDLDSSPRTVSFYKDNVLQGTRNLLSSGEEYVISFLQNNSGQTIGINYGQRTFINSPPSGFKSICTLNMPATVGATFGSFTGNANADGPYIYTGAVPLTLSINGNAVTWGTHADKLATGFKVRTSSSSYNSTGTNNWTSTYSTPQKPTVGINKIPSNAQGNP